MRHLILITMILLAGSLLLADAMPDFRLPDINRNEVKLADILNKGPVLVDFWASWCISCKRAMPALNQLAEKYDSLTIVMISIDAPKDVAKAKRFMKGNDFKFINLFDTERRLAKKLNVVNPPRTFILDKTGEIVLSHEGYEPGTEKKYEAKIRELLNLPAESETEADTEKIMEPNHEKSHPCGGCQ